MSSSIAISIKTWPDLTVVLFLIYILKRINTRWFSNIENLLAWLIASRSSINLPASWYLNTFYEARDIRFSIPN